MSAGESASGAGVLAPPMPIAETPRLAAEGGDFLSAMGEFLPVLPAELHSLIGRIRSTPEPSESRDSRSSASFIRDLLHGPVPPDLPDPATEVIEFCDPALDGEQRDAVRQATESPDICLIGGATGTGKSRVMAEIVRQAVRRGNRILFVAPSTAAIDVVLEQLTDDAGVFHLRCVSSGESPEQLPDAIRRWTPDAWRHRLGTQLMDQSDWLVQEQRRRIQELAACTPADARESALAGEIASIRSNEQRAIAEERRFEQALADLQREIAATDSLFSRLLFWRSRNTADLEKRRRAIEVERQEAAARTDAIRNRLIALESEQRLLAENVRRDSRDRDVRRANEQSILAKLEAWKSFVSRHADEFQRSFGRVVNLVAVTTGDELECMSPACGLDFDLLIVDEAHRISEPTLMDFAKHARRAVLSGEPNLATCTAALTSSPCACHFWPHLWQSLHVDIWRREHDVWRCQLQPMRAFDPAGLHRESVADRADVELWIRANGHQRSDLVEVVFPTGFSLADACRYVFCELKELPVPAGEPAWQEHDGHCECRWHETGANDAVELEPGVFASFRVSQTSASLCGLRFGCSAGWNRSSALSWFEQHTRRVDPARTAILKNPCRQ